VAASDFGFTDSDGNSLLTVKVNTLGLNGATLKLNGTDVTAGQIISATAIAGGQLTYRAPANANGAAFSSITFQVQDDGGTATGGIDLDATPHTMTMNLSIIANTAPTGQNKTVGTLEDAPYTFTLNDFPISDAQNNNLRAVRITSLAGLNGGTLTDNGLAVT